MFVPKDPTKESEVDKWLKEHDKEVWDILIEEQIRYAKRGKDWTWLTKEEREEKKKNQLLKLEEFK